MFTCSIRHYHGIPQCVYQINIYFTLFPWYNTMYVLFVPLVYVIVMIKYNVRLRFTFSIRYNHHFIHVSNQSTTYNILSVVMNSYFLLFAICICQCMHFTRIYNKSLHVSIYIAVLKLIASDEERDNVETRRLCKRRLPV